MNVTQTFITNKFIYAIIKLSDKVEWQKILNFGRSTIGF